MGRKVQSYVLKDQEVFVGLEDSKKTWKVCVRSGGMVVDDRTSMPANYSALKGYFDNRFPGCAIHVMYEAGFRGFGLHDALTADGIHCVVTPPHTVSEEKCNRQKNDRTDCRRLAKNLENGDYKECHVHSLEHREDREVSRTFGQFQRERVRVKNQIRRKLEWHGIDGALRPGSWGDADYRLLPERLQKLGVSESVRFCIDMLLEQLWFVEGQRRKLLARLRELARDPKYKAMVDILKSAPGIGELTAIRLVLEWGDVRRFKRKEQFASFLGLIPSDYSTGETDRKGHITKQGNRDVRRWLIEGAWVAIRKDPVLLAKYNRVLRATGSKKKAIVAVARKLALRLRCLLLQDSMYQLGVIE